MAGTNFARAIRSEPKEYFDKNHDFETERRSGLVSKRMSAKFSPTRSALADNQARAECRPSHYAVATSPC